MFLEECPHPAEELPPSGVVSGETSLFQRQPYVLGASDIAFIAELLQPVGENQPGIVVVGMVEDGLKQSGSG